MEDASPATFRPTWQQSLARGLYLGLLISLVGLVSGALATGVAVAWTEVTAPPSWLWVALAVGPPLIGVLLGPPVRRRPGAPQGGGGGRAVGPPPPRCPRATPSASRLR